jgi:pimeloyl-ACP methyl ester carboxylesterase
LITDYGQIKTLVVSSTQCYNKLPARGFYKLKFPPKPFRDIEPELKEKLIYWHGKDYAELFYNLINSKLGGAYGTEFFDLRDLLPSVTCPTLVLYPDRSFYFDVEQGVAFYRPLPKGELAVLPNCGHNTYENQPKEYIRFVLSFLKRHNF